MVKPYSRIDKMIGNYIEKHSGNDFNQIVSKDERLEVASYLSELANGLLGWYPYKPDGKILQIGSWFGAFTEMLSFHCKHITIIEQDSYRACMTEKRLSSLKNLDIVNQEIIEYCRTCEIKFDYIIFAVDERIDVIPDVNSYHEILKAVKVILDDKGKLLLAIPNRLGVKYLCGSPDPNTKVRFGGITEESSGLYRFDREELLRLVKEQGYLYVKMYYPMPDHHLTQLIYTDDLRPGEDILERIHVYKDHKAQRLLDEWNLMGRLAKNGVMHCFCNSFLVEAGNTPCSGIIYSALSVERDRSRAFATNIYNNGIVEKVPIYPEGYEGICRLLENTNELAAKGIPVLEMERKGSKAVMKQIYSPSLSQYLNRIVREDVNLFIDCIDRLRGYIWSSSEHVTSEKNCMLKWAPDEDWGVILRKAYIEMIPVNSFYDNGDMLFYDQEFTKDNCPANYVLYRALHDVYAFSPEIEQIISLDLMKERYNLSQTWTFYEREEAGFQAELRRRNIYIGFQSWIYHPFGNVEENRRQLDLPEERQGVEAFNAFSQLDNRRIILFGSGRLAEYYLNRYGKIHPPVFLVDNNSDRWGSKKDGFEIRDPKCITQLMQGTYRVIIAIKNYEPIAEQLENMDIGEDSYRIFSSEMDLLVTSKLSYTMLDGKYHIGYTAGIFDSFGLDDLELLKQCKTHSHYLIAGVFTDELIWEQEGKEASSSFEERSAMVKQCKYVNQVIPVDFHNANMIDAWKELRYGCLFERKTAQNDPDKKWLQRKLCTLGSALKFI